jgi:hypothetical protein
MATPEAGRNFPWQTVPVYTLRKIGELVRKQDILYLLCQIIMNYERTINELLTKY